MTIEHNISCHNCKKLFSRDRRNLNKKSKFKFCSKKCGTSFYKTIMTIECYTCSKPIKRVLSVFNKSKTKRFFCSHSCSAKYSNSHKTVGTRRSKLEIKLESIFRLNYPDLDIICNKTSCIPYELDFYFPSLKLAFEINGILHYKPVYGVKKLTATQKTDSAKILLCGDLGIKLHQFDIYSIHSDEKKFINLCLELLEATIASAKLNNINIISLDPLRGADKIIVPVVKIPSSLIQHRKIINKAFEFKTQLEKEKISASMLAKNLGFTRAYASMLLCLTFLPPERINQILTDDTTKISWKELLKEGRSIKNSSKTNSASGFSEDRTLLDKG